MVIARGAPAPGPLQRRPAPAPDFRTLLGEVGWAGLAPAIRARFAATSALGDFSGTAELNASAAGRGLAQLMRLFGGPLPWITGRGRARVRIQKGPRGALWDRAYQTGRGGWIHVRSLKRAAAGRLYECAGPIWMRLKLEARGRALVFLSDGFFLALGPLRLRLPDVLTPGALTVIHTDEGEGRFAFILTCDHPVFGRLFDQTIRLADAPLQGAGHA
ncbi:MAG: DUF4166 domain-containing protein [Oceanicaulis sp.]